MKFNEETIAYHGTDEKYLNDILNMGFKIKENKEHWLGNGIYFFLDYEVAKWWSNSPTKRFGNNNEKPIVIKVNIVSNKENTIDTRYRKDYNELMEKYEKFTKEVLKKGQIVNNITINQLRCSFFDWLHSNYEVDILIVGFIKELKQKDLVDKFKIPYSEFQLCVFNDNLIVKKERVYENE